ncbi:hypothetical protein BJ912DRAFT_1113209 [Pholiota molesta]|nr:hypothetical protein BJ912DRAFT_1113209 [Pholiota molesta]
MTLSQLSRFPPPAASFLPSQLQSYLRYFRMLIVPPSRVWHPSPPTRRKPPPQIADGWTTRSSSRPLLPVSRVRTSPEPPLLLLQLSAERVQIARRVDDEHHSTEQPPAYMCPSYSNHSVSLRWRSVAAYTKPTGSKRSGKRRGLQIERGTPNFYIISPSSLMLSSSRHPLLQPRLLFSQATLTQNTIDSVTYPMYQSAFPVTAPTNSKSQIRQSLVNTLPPGTEQSLTQAFVAQLAVTPSPIQSVGVTSRVLVPIAPRPAGKEHPEGATALRRGERQPTSVTVTDTDTIISTAQTSIDQKSGPTGSPDQRVPDTAVTAVDGQITTAGSINTTSKWGRRSSPCHHGRTTQRHDDDNDNGAADVGSSAPTTKKGEETARGDPGAGDPQACMYNDHAPRPAPPAPTRSRCAPGLTSAPRHPPATSSCGARTRRQRPPTTRDVVPRRQQRIRCPAAPVHPDHGPTPPATSSRGARHHHDPCLVDHHRRTL